MANTPLRNIRVSDEIWNAALMKASKDNTTVTQVLIMALEKYIKK